MGLGHHDLLLILGRHGGKLGLQVLQRAVPVGVVGGGEHVVVHLVAGQHVGELGVVPGLGVGEVDGDEHIGIEGADRLAPRPVDGAHLGHGGLPADALGGLVADLDHGDIRPGVPDELQALGGVGFDLGRLAVLVQVRPGLGGLLLGGVRPEVGVVEVHQELQAVFGRPGADLAGGLGCAVAAAVAVAVLVEGVHPDPDPDAVEAAVGQDLEHVLGLAVEVFIDDAALLLGQEARHVRAQEEILGQAVDLLHVQGVGLHGGCLLLRFGRLFGGSRAACEQGDS